MSRSAAAEVFTNLRCALSFFRRCQNSERYSSERADAVLCVWSTDIDRVTALLGESVEKVAVKANITALCTAAAGSSPAQKTQVAFPVVEPSQSPPRKTTEQLCCKSYQLEFMEPMVSLIHSPFLTQEPRYLSALKISPEN